MKAKKIVQVFALSILLIAGGAAAQTAGSVNVSSTPVTSAVSPGTGVNLGTITLSSVQGGGNVNALPITISASNGGLQSNLSNCQLYNNQNVSLTSNGIVNTVSGTNTFTFNSPLAVNSSTGTTTLSLRCNVASNVASGSIFTVNAGAASIGPVLRVNLDTAPTVPAGSNDVALANISVGATGASFNVTSIPLMISASSNGSVANLSDCKVRNTANPDSSLSNVTVVANGTATSFNLINPLFVPAGAAYMLALTCDVQPATAVGSTFSISITPGSVMATNASSGGSVTAVGVAAGGTGPNGLPASTSGSVAVTAQGTTIPGDTDTGTIPGVPNTGIGTGLGILAMISIAGLIALMGAFYLGRKHA